MNHAPYRPVFILLAMFILFAIAFAGEAASGVLDIGAGTNPAFVLNRSGAPVIVYSSDSLVLATCSDLACPTVSLTPIPGTSFGAQPSIALTPTGQPVISYYNTSTRDLALAVCDDARCLNATVSIVDSGGDVGQYSSIQLSSSGTPVISYYDATNGDLVLASCHNLFCTDRTLRHIDRARDVGQFTALRLISSGRPVISYYDATRGDLKLAVCNHTSCSNPAISTVDSSGSVGQFTALVINSSSRPVISYYDATQGDLKLAVCGNLTCTYSALRTVDRVGSVGQYTSLALDASNRPTISYFAAERQTARLALCRDTTCANRDQLDMGQGIAASTAVALRNSRGVYAAFVNSMGRVTVFADIPTPTGCYIDAPEQVGEGTTFSVTVRCDGLTVPVYGFEFGLRAAGGAMPNSSAFAPGTFVVSAGADVLDAVNRLDSYAVSRRSPAASATGSFSLGTVDYTAPFVYHTSTITLTLDKLLLGDIQGALLNVPAIPTVVVKVVNGSCGGYGYSHQASDSG